MAESHLEVQGPNVLEKVGNKVVNTKDYQHVITGYKATISSPRTSEEAKENARQMIKALEEAENKSLAGSGTAVGTDDTTEEDTVHRHRVIGGMKAALKNEHVSEDAKAEIRARLDEMGEQHI